MKQIFIVVTAALLTGCSLFQSVKTPLQSTPGNHIKAGMNTNGYSVDWLDQQNSTYSNISMTVNSNGMSTFNASGVTHTMDPGVISMSGASYLASQQAQYAAQQAVLAQVLQFAASVPTKAALLAPAPTDSSLALAQVMNRMLDVITNQEAMLRASVSTNKP